MFKTISYDTIDKNMLKGNYVLVDVRSPGEFNSETIPGAINIPLFYDDERKLIGTIYTQESVEKAKRIGIQVASSRLPVLYERILELEKQYDNIILFCARGGYRSSSLVSLFMTLGVNIFKLEGGYKGYRHYINENLPKILSEIQFVTIYGNTGTGKTHILKFLKEEGMDILDLEGCANHRGSLLGSVGLGKQNTQKMFESLVYESLKNRKTNVVFLEGESKRIGRIIIPEYLYSKIGMGKNIRIDADIKSRVNNVLKDYVHETDNELISALNLLRKHLSNTNIDRFICMLKNHEYEQVIEELMTKYYDPLYNHNNISYDAVFYNIDTEETSIKIIEWLKKTVSKQ